MSAITGLIPRRPQTAVNSIREDGTFAEPSEFVESRLVSEVNQIRTHFGDVYNRGTHLCSRVYEEADARRGRLGADPRSLSTKANNIAIELVEPVSFGTHREFEPDYILNHGGMCLEASLVAEMSAHVLYSFDKSKPPYNAGTSIVMARMRHDDGSYAYHAVVKLEATGLGDNGEEYTMTRVLDPMSHEGDWNDFVGNRFYSFQDAGDSPPVVVDEIIGETSKSPFIWLPPVKAVH